MRVSRGGRRGGELPTHPNCGWLEVLYIANDCPAGHQHEEVGEHVLFLRVPEWVGKLTTILQGTTDNDKKLIIIHQIQSKSNAANLY